MAPKMPKKSMRANVYRVKLPQHPNASIWPGADTHAETLADIGPIFAPYVRVLEQHTSEDGKGNSGVRYEGSLYQMKFDDKRTTDEYCLVWHNHNGYTHIKLNGADLKNMNSELCNVAHCNVEHHPAQIYHHFANSMWTEHDIPYLSAAECEAPTKNPPTKGSTEQPLPHYFTMHQQAIKTLDDADDVLTDRVTVFEPSAQFPQDDFAMVKAHIDDYLLKLKQVFTSSPSTCCVTPSKDNISFEECAEKWNHQTGVALDATIKTIALQSKNKPNFGDALLSKLLQQIIEAHENNSIAIRHSASADTVKKMACSERIWAVMRVLKSFVLVRKDVAAQGFDELIKAPYVVAHRKLNNFRGNSGKAKSKKDHDAGGDNDGGDGGPDDDSDDDDHDDSNGRDRKPIRGTDKSTAAPRKRGNPDNGVTTRSHKRTRQEADANDNEYDIQENPRKKMVYPGPPYGTALQNNTSFMPAFTSMMPQPYPNPYAVEQKFVYQDPGAGTFTPVNHVHMPLYHAVPVPGYTTVGRKGGFEDTAQCELEKTRAKRVNHTQLDLVDQSVPRPQQYGVSQELGFTQQHVKVEGG